MDLVVLALFLLIFPLYFLLTKKKPKRVPPGSMGFPLVGQTVSFVRAMKQNTIEQWLRERIIRYGPISKMNIFGTPTVFLKGPAANKVFYTSPHSLLTSKQPSSFRRIFGPRNIVELSGPEHKRVRGALVSFLKPDVLKQYVTKMDAEIKREIRTHLGGKKENVQAMPFMKALTFNMMTSLIVGIEHGSRSDKLIELFHETQGGVVAVPINLPFTAFGRSLKAREKLNTIILEVIGEKKAALEKQQAVPEQDLITCLISLQNEDTSAMLCDEEILDNVVQLIFAGYDSTATLLTLLIRVLASDASIQSKILGEHENIARSKAPGELLTWDDLLKMKYTWSVALETLRMYNLAILNVRKVMKDFEYEGFVIPKGWQIVVTGLMTHMDDSIFPNASKFDPTRFEKQPSIPPYSFVPFGGGHRICPGNEFAKIETLVTIHNLVTQYTWRLSSLDMSFSRVPFPCFKNGLEIEIEPTITRELK